MEYMEAKRSYTEAKAKQRALHKCVQTLQQKNQPMHDFKKHLETRLRRINEQRDGKKDAAKKKFKSMKTKWDENDKLVTRIVYPFTILINWLHYSGNARRGDFKQSRESQEGRKKSREEDPRSRTACSKPAGRPSKAHQSRRYFRDRRGDCMFSLFKLHLYRLLGQGRLNQSHSNTRDRQIDLKEQQRRLVDDESRANAEVAEGESLYAMTQSLFGAVSIYCSIG